MESPFSKTDIDVVRNFGVITSQCSRRKYGAIIRDNFGNSVYGANVRVGKSCTSSYCVRDRLSLVEGNHDQTEKGAELHAEQAAIIEWRRIYLPQCNPYHILIAATNGAGPLDGLDNKPCYVCARMLKYAGFDNVWLPFGEEPKPVSLSGVMEAYERIHTDF